MQAMLFDVHEKVKNGDMDFARFADFRCGAPVHVDALSILNTPGISLYCLDDEQRQAVFVETPPEIDLTRQAFYYQAQYRCARRVLSVPYETLNELATERGEPFRNLVLIFSVGRCGSTLLSRALNCLDTVLCLDEPDVYTGLTLWRAGDGSRDAEFTRLLKSCTRLLYRPTQLQANTLALKFRSFSIQIADLFHSAFPAAKILFLYRNPETWARSFARSIAHLLDHYEGTEPQFELFRLFDVWEVAEQKVRGNGSHPKPRRTPPVRGRHILERTIPLLLPYIRKSLKARLTVRDYAALAGLRAVQLLPVARDRFRTPDQYLEPFIRSLPPVKLLMMAWLSAIARYQALSDQGVPIMAVRYETLVASPSDSLRRIFEFCDLSCSQTSLAEAVFAEDSQGGTMYSRKSLRQSADRELSAEQLSQVDEVLREHPAIRPPDQFAPDTLTI